MAIRTTIRTLFWGCDMDVVGSIAPGPGRASDTTKKKLRSDAEIEFHYRVEVELASRLRDAPRAERLGLYGAVYDELFRRVPTHPQLTRKVSEAEQRAGVADRIALLLPFIGPDTVFLEIGAGDGSLTLEVAKPARRNRLVGRLLGARAGRLRHRGLQLPGDGAHSPRRRARAVAQPVRRHCA